MSATGTPSGGGQRTSRGETAFALEAVIGRLLVVGTWTAMALVMVGVVLGFATGVDPLTHGAPPPFSPAQVIPDILALQPAGFLWAGIVLIICLPIGRVIVAGFGFLAAGDSRLALISLAVLLVVIVSIVAALGLVG